MTKYEIVELSGRTREVSKKEFYITKVIMFVIFTILTIAIVTVCVCSAMAFLETLNNLSV